MKYVSAADLAERISAVMTSVRAGEEVTLTEEGGQAVARIVPVSRGDADVADHRESGLPLAPPTPAEVLARRTYLRGLRHAPLFTRDARWTRDELYEDDPE